MKKFYCIVCGKYRKSKNTKKSYIFGKILAFSIICSKCKNEYKKISEEKELIEILKIVDLIYDIEEYQ